MQFRCIWKLGVSMILLSPLAAQEDPLGKLVAQGRDLEAQGRFPQAEAAFRAALQQAQLRPSEPLLAAAMLDCLASNAADQALFGEAERLYLRALSIVEKAAGPESKATATILWHMAGMYGEAGRMAAAEPLLEKYQAILLKNLDGNSSAEAADLGNLGRIYAYRHSVHKALPLFERAMRILEKQKNPDDTDMARALLDRASALAVVGQTVNAAADVERASVLISKLALPAPTLQIDLALTAGLVYTHAHRKSDAQGAFEQAINLGESHYGLTHPVLATILKDYSQALKQLGDKKEASALDKRVKRIYSASSQSKMLGYAVDIHALRP